MRLINKKKVSLFLALVSVACMSFAQTDLQTLQFVDKDGKVVENGSVIAVDQLEKEEFEPDALGFISTGLSVKNTTPQEVGVGLIVSVQKMDNGAAQFCFPKTCQEIKAKGTFSQNGSLTANVTQDVATEWFPAAYGECTMTLKLQVLKIKTKFPPSYSFVADGPQVTVHFVNAGPTGIKHLDTSVPAQDKAKMIFDALGIKRTQLQKGINIVKYTDGTVRKVLVK